MGLVERAKNICLTPKTEWPVIAAETTATKDLMISYVAPLAIIGPLAGFIGGTVIGHSMPFVGTYRTPVLAGIGVAIFSFVMTFVAVFILSLIINELAPTFGGEKNKQQALKVAVYSYTPAWIAGILSIIPFLGLLAIFAAFYGIYLLYLGLPKLMKCPEDKSIGYTAVVVICAIVISAVLTAMAGMFAGAGLLASGMSRASSPSVTFDKDSAVGKLEDFGKKMEDVGKKMEAAQKSGNQEEAAKAAMAGLGAVLGGGKSVESVDIEKLKPFIPETLAGLARKSSRSEKNGVLGVMITKAEAEYADAAGKSIQLAITDTGGASGIMGLASWASVQGEKEDQYGSEKTQKVNGRLVHESSRKSGGGEYSVVIAERFMVEAKSSTVDLNTLKSAVSGIDLGKLESMKDEGVKK